MHIKISLILLTLFLGAFQPVSSQEQIKLVTGVVTDEDGVPLPGVDITLQDDESKGTSTDFDGNFKIQVSPNETLKITSIGFETAYINIDGQDQLNIVLKPSMNELDELIVVGYGKKKKRDLTGSIESITSEEISNSNAQDPISVLQGRAAGVQVTSSSGAPGGGMSLRVRGNSSLNAGNSPLYVIDGIPVESISLSSLNGDDAPLNPLADINPNDIESIEILKDASSTAIYGSRAANGVILITTKRGKVGEAQINIDLSYGLSEITRKLSVLNASQYRQVIIDSYRNMDNPEIPNPSIIDSLNAKNNGDVDWQEEMLRTARQYKANVSVRGGSEDTQYAWSSSFLDQDGIVLNSNYQRFTSRLNLDFKASDKLKFGQSLSYTHDRNNRINAGGSGNLSVIRELLIRPPTYPNYLPDGSLNGYQFGKRNPIGLAELATHLNKKNRIIASQFAEYEITEGLTLRSNLNLDFIAMKEDEFIPSSLDYREGYNTGAVRSLNNLTWGNETFLSFNHSFNNTHHLSAVAGFSFQNWKSEMTGLDGMFFSSDEIRTLNSAGTISNQEVNVANEHSMRSYFGRLSYDYKGKYLAEVNFRADGSSRFGKDKRFGYFPSASVGWRFSDEPFLKNNILTDGKLRISVGQTGNEAIGNYTARGEFTVGTNYLDKPGAAPIVTPNQRLTWEKTTQYNVGLDLSFLKNRINLNADMYLKKTSDLLYNVPIPRTTGFAFITQNIGGIENKGVELSLSTHNLVNEFKWSTRFNISANRNKVTDLPEELLTNGYIQNGKYQILKEGSPIGTFFGYKFNGVYATDEDNVDGLTYGAQGPTFKGGEPIWEDTNGDGVIDDNDKQIIGDATPDFFGGITNEFAYKNFSLSVFFQFSYGNDIYSEINHQRNSVVRYNNLSTDALNRWRKPGDITDFPKPVRDDPRESDSRIQSRWVEDGSYIKLKNINLNYSFPKQIINPIGLTSLNAYITASNLITWTHYTGFDPDVNAFSGIRPGVDNGVYPQSRTFILGLKIGL